MSTGWPKAYTAICRPVLITCRLGARALRWRQCRDLRCAIREDRAPRTAWQAARLARRRPRRAQSVLPRVSRLANARASGPSCPARSPPRPASRPAVASRRYTTASFSSVELEQELGVDPILEPGVGHAEDLHHPD